MPEATSAEEEEHDQLNVLDPVGRSQPLSVDKIYIGVCPLSGAQVVHEHLGLKIGLFVMRCSFLLAAKCVKSLEVQHVHVTGAGAHPSSGGTE